MEKVKVKITSSCLVNGEHCDKGKIAEVSASDARTLIAINKAEKFEGEEIPVYELTGESLQKLTANQLKLIAESRGLDKSGKKDDLVSRILDSKEEAK